MIKLAAAMIAALVLMSTADAKPRFEAGGILNRDDRYPHTMDVRGWKDAAPFRVSPRRVHRRAGHVRATRQAVARPVERVARYEAPQILPHPSGCPRRAFCGCGAAVRIFGRPIRELWLAANWFRFPRAEPAPGMVAVRHHHVFVIEEVIDRRTVVAYDANSGGHLTRRHLRSLAGYSVRKPQGNS